MPVPELPEGRIRISDTARTGSITDFRTTILHSDLINGIVKHLLDVFDIFSNKTYDVIVGMMIRFLVLFLDVKVRTTLANFPSIFVVGFLGVVQVPLSSYWDVHAEADAHVRVGELVLRFWNSGSNIFVSRQISLSDIVLSGVLNLEIV